MTKQNIEGTELGEVTGVSEIEELAIEHPGCPNAGPEGKADDDHNFVRSRSVVPTEDPDSGPKFYLYFKCSCGHEQDRYL